MVDRKRKPEQCSIEGCWKDAKVKGFCPACYSWWLRAKTLSNMEFAARTAKYTRMNSRIKQFRKGA